MWILGFHDQVGLDLGLLILLEWIMVIDDLVY